ncbi:unnamed protein product [Closterium sp. NIES-54]
MCCFSQDYRHLDYGGLPESLAPLPYSPAPPCTPCVEGRQHASPHSSPFPPTTATFHTLHLDVCGPSPVRGPCQEHYILIVVDDYSRYTTVLPLRWKANVPTVLELWLLSRVCYATHQLNLWPSDAWPWVRPLSLWTGSSGAAADYRVWGSVAHVRALSANKLSPHTRACVFLGLAPDISSWQFYDLVTCQFFNSQDITFDESVSYYRSRSSPLKRPAPNVSGGAGDAAAEGVGSGAAGARGDGSGVAGGVRVETTPEEDTPVSTQQPRPASPSGFPFVQQFFARLPLRLVAAELGAVPVGGTGVPGGVVGGGSGSGDAGARDTSVATPTPRTVRFVTHVQRLDRLEREEREQIERAQQQQQQQQQQQSQLEHQKRVEEESLLPQQVQLGPQQESVEELRLQQQVQLQPHQERVEEESRPLLEVQLRPQHARVEELHFQQQLQLQPHQERVEEELRSQQQVQLHPQLERVEEESRLQQQVQLQPPQERVEEEPHLEQEEQQQGQASLQQTSEEVEKQRLIDLPDPAPARLVCGPLPSPLVPLVESIASSPWSRCSPLVLAVSPEPRRSRYRANGPFHLVLRSRVPPPPVLPNPPESSLTVFHDPLSDYLRASHPVISLVLSALVSHPTAPLLSVSAFVTTVAGFTSSYRLDYASHLVSCTAHFPSAWGVPVFPLEVLEGRQFELGFLAAAVPHLCAMLLAPKGDPNALDIPIPRTYAKAVSGPWASYWIATEDAEMASYRSTGTYVDAVPPTFQCEGVDFFQTFTPTLKMTTLQVLLHIAPQRDYELHSLDCSRAFLEGSLHELGPSGSCVNQSTACDRLPSAHSSLFIHRGSTPFFVLVYVDDLVFATPGRRALAYVKEELQRRHTSTDLGELQRYLGLQITRDKSARTITLTQSHMVEQILMRFGFPFSKVQPTPLAVDHGLMAPPSHEPFESSGPYPELVGCLMYPMTCTRSDLAYPLSILARFVAPGRHRPSYSNAAKRVAKYVAGTSGTGLVLRGKQPVTLIGFWDSSWADDAESVRPTQGYYFSLESGAVLWRSTRASSVSSSSCEAEVYAAAMAAQELPWLSILLTGLGEWPRVPLVLFTDNRSSILLCEEPCLVQKAKHIQ